MRNVFWLLMLSIAALIGCNRSPPPQVAVHGKVMINGEPLRGGTIVFTPDEKRGARGPVSHAVLDSEGTFSLASENGPGAVAGWHRITVAPPPASTDLIAALEKYRHPDLSGLEFEVRTGQDNSVPLKLEASQ